jgi:hypothetical protein
MHRCQAATLRPWRAHRWHADRFPCFQADAPLIHKNFRLGRTQGNIIGEYQIMIPSDKISISRSGRSAENTGIKVMTNGRFQRAGAGFPDKPGWEEK